MAEPKTRMTDASVADFIAKIADENQRADSKKIVTLMKKVTGAQPKMWGDAIIGFGLQKIKYAGGKELDWPITAFSPRKQSLVLYVLTGKEKPEQMKRLGKHSTGKVCLYIKRLSDIDFNVLEELVTQSVAATNQ